MKTSSSTEFLPLREPTFYILLSLAPAPGAKHGYAILKEVEALSSGRVLLSTGTLYEALARLLDQGLIERIDENSSSPSNAAPGKPRKFYRLTQTGRSVIAAETTRLSAQVSAAQRHLGAIWTNEDSPG
jgi:DNA-binding PadR family transcriptional regulator